MQRLIASIVVLIIYSAIEFPVPTIVISLVLIFGYLLLGNKLRFTQNIRYNQDRALRRRIALENARMYLSPYTDIWKNLKLSNKFCTIKLTEEQVIIGKEKRADKTKPYRTFRIVSSQVHHMSDIWDMFCLNFDHNKTYDGLVEDCRLFKVTILENTINGNPDYVSSGKEIQSVKSDKKLDTVEKVDVNNCSEIELTALPGISIVMSKKIIKKREEIGGFKDVNEFFVYMKLKPHIETQLRELVCVTKMRGSTKIERHSERSVDL